MMNNTIDINRMIFGLFLGCGHCKRAKPEFAQTAEHFKDDPKTELAAVDCTRYSTLCASFEVRGYPTIKYFNYLKTVREYNGDRTETGFINFLKDPDAASKKSEKTLEPFGDFQGSNEILLLTDSNFEEVIKREPSLLIMFYAPWCGHCKNMKPEFAKAAQLLAEENISAKVAALDCTVHTKAAERFNIRGYPTLKFFREGQFRRNYEGNRTAQDMVKFLRSGGSPTKDEL